MVRISVELPDEMAEALDRAAGELQSTREAVLLAAARDYLAGRGDGFDAFMADRPAFEAWIAEGEAAAASGRTVSFEEAIAEMDAIIARAHAPRG